LRQSEKAYKNISTVCRFCSANKLFGIVEQPSVILIFRELLMSALVNGLECSECERLSSSVIEIRAQIFAARTELQKAIDAADGTSARKHEELQALLRMQDHLVSEMKTHNGTMHTGYVAENTLTHDVLET
jgi:hypothetical protein